MSQVERVSKDEIDKKVKPHLDEHCVVRRDGWRAYGVLASEQSEHEPEGVGCGENAVKVVPWVHTLIENIKGNIRGVYHGVSPKHLERYLPECCYRFNRRSWESQIFDRLLTACISTSTIAFSELKA